MEVLVKGDKVAILINEKWCTGCEICVEFCPVNALVMNGEVVKVKDINACTKCMLCELRCPDFAIKVGNRDEFDEKKEREGKEK